MDPLEIILQELRANGQRITEMRRLLLAIFTKHHKPLSGPEILQKLLEKKKTVSKATLYRQLGFFCAQNILQPIRFREREKRYELSARYATHHHHLVCSQCKTIQEVKIQKVEKELQSAEERFKERENFKTLSHSLEFFGLCAKCQK